MTIAKGMRAEVPFRKQSHNLVAPRNPQAPRGKKAANKKIAGGLEKQKKKVMKSSAPEAPRE